MKTRVLVVEDNPTNLALMEYLLRAYGYEVLTATDGAKGIEAVRREMPDVILMDLQMPIMNGFEAVNVLKADPALRAIPVVAVTALAMVGDRENILAHHFNGYIAKPITPETFVTQVQTYVPVKAGSELSPSQLPTAENQPGNVRAAVAKILVVDNSHVNLSLAESTLGPLGYKVIPAQNVSDAMQIMRTDLPDLILSDVHMPGQDGYDFIRIVKADERLRAVPFVFLSSSVWGDKERHTSLALGADRFILRPIEASALISEIRDCMKVTHFTLNDSADIGSPEKE
jgi:two-component system cell cycle response regulator